MIQGAIETIIYGMKLGIILGLSTAFLLAINTLINLGSMAFSSSALGQIAILISMFLPFNAGSVFGLLGTLISGIITFLVARKVFNLSRNSLAVFNI